MLWQINDFQIQVIVPASNATEGQTFLSLRIMTSTDAEKIEALEQNEEMASIRTSADTAVIEALIQEMSSYVKHQNSSSHYQRTQ